MALIGLDFSINKPAACIFDNYGYHRFIGWPYDPQGKIQKLYEGSGAKIIARTDDKEKGDNISSKMRYEVENSQYLARIIVDELLPWLAEDTRIAFEGLSYASSGDVVLQLGGYKYMLMSALSKYVSLDNMYTYSPITVKSIAGCAKKGMGKPEMIRAFVASGTNSEFRSNLELHPEKYTKKNGINWIDHVDDLVDAFWVLKTMIVKEKLLD